MSTGLPKPHIWLHACVSCHARAPPKNSGNSATCMRQRRKSTAACEEHPTSTSSSGCNFRKPRKVCKKQLGKWVGTSIVFLIMHRHSPPPRKKTSLSHQGSSHPIHIHITRISALFTACTITCSLQPTTQVQTFCRSAAAIAGWRGAVGDVAHVGPSLVDSAAKRFFNFRTIPQLLQ
jgi:hypothetical protein